MSGYNRLYEYAKHLETENKRLRELLDKHAAIAENNDGPANAWFNFKAFAKEARAALEGNEP